MDSMTVYNMTKEIDLLTLKNSSLQSEVDRLNRTVKATRAGCAVFGLGVLLLGIFNTVELMLFEEKMTDTDTVVE